MSGYHGQVVTEGSKRELQSRPNKFETQKDSSESKCKDCTITLNDTGDTPSVPSSGKFQQWRVGGADSSAEMTQHTFTGLGKGYPATLTIDKTGDTGEVKPKYIYEHDYKIKDNGYVGADSSYSWYSNLPGAYRDTRAPGLGGVDDNAFKLDFTIGSAYTWELDPTKEYKVATYVTGRSASNPPTSSEAALTASVVPNDGGMSPWDAAFKDGCIFKTDTMFYPREPIAVAAPEGDLAWCGGIGNMISPKSVKNISLIKKPTFPVRGSGTCYQWTTGNGYVTCTPRWP